MSDSSDLDLDALERDLRDVISSIETAIGSGFEQATECDEAIAIGQLDLGIERLGVVLSELQDTLESARGLDWIDLGACARRALERVVVDVPVPLGVESRAPSHALKARVNQPCEAPAGLARLISVVLRACGVGDVVKLSTDAGERSVSLSLELTNETERTGLRCIDAPSRAPTLHEIAESIGGLLELGPTKLVLRLPRADAPAGRD